MISTRNQYHLFLSTGQHIHIVSELITNLAFGSTNRTGICPRGPSFTSDILGVVTGRLTYSSRSSRVTKDSGVSRFREFTALICQVFRCRYVMNSGPVLSCSNLRSRENDRVEWHVARYPWSVAELIKMVVCCLLFAHKLVQLYIFWVLPPFLPIFGVGCGDGRITNACIEPDIHDFVLVAGERHRSAPFQI